MTLPTQILGTVVETNRAIGRLEGKLDGVIEQLARNARLLETHDKKIGTLETGYHRRVGFSAGVGAVMGVAFTFVTTKLGIPKL